MKVQAGLLASWSGAIHSYHRDLIYSPTCSWYEKLTKANMCSRFKKASSQIQTLETAVTNVETGKGSGHVIVYWNNSNTEEFRIGLRIRHFLLQFGGSAASAFGIGASSVWRRFCAFIWEALEIFCFFSRFGNLRCKIWVDRSWPNSIPSNFPKKMKIG